MTAGPLDRSPLPAPPEPAAPDPRTDSGIPVRPLYGPADVAAPETYAERLGLPGEPPFTRGVRPGMYRDQPWAVRQLAGYSTPEHTNARLRLLLERGATAINTVFDFVTNRGYDSDDPLAAGDVGQGGVAVDSVEDMLELYAGIPLDQVSVSLVISHPVAAGVVLAMYFAAAERRGYRLADLRGTLQNDLMMETVVLTAPSVLDPAFALSLSTDVVEFCLGQAPRFNGVSYAGYNYREAGANAVEEVALVIANAVATATEMSGRGHSVDSFATRLTAFFTADSDFFEEVAKYRAARRVYERVLRDRLGARSPRSRMLRYHVQTSGSSLTAQQPLNNAVRAGYQALAAALGGAQSLHVSAYDEALSIPSEQAALTALATQHILRAETGVLRTADPLAGSYLVEHLTDEMERRISSLLEEIDQLGGLVAAIERGWVHERVLRNAYERELAVADGSRPVVGVNCFQAGESLRVDPFEVPEARPNQVSKLTALRSRRPSTAVDSALAALRGAVSEGRNTMPALLDAARAGVTVGECAAVFRAAHGGWRQPLL